MEANLADSARSRNRQRLAAGSGPALIALLSLLFLLGYLVPDRTTVLPILEDIAEMRPYRAMVTSAWANGRFPLWSPSYLSGFPLAGWAHASAFYPFGFIFALTDYNRAVVINLFLHIMIFGTGMYALLRSLAISRPASTIAAVMVSFGPMLSYWQLSFLPTIYTAAWAPWLFASALALLDRPRLIYVAGMALAFALQVTGGRYDLITREVAMMGAAALILAARRKSHQKVLVLWTLGGVIGALTVFAIMPLHYEYVHRSVRLLGLDRTYWMAFQKETHVLALGLFLGTFPSILAALAGLRHSSRRPLVMGAAGAGLVALLWVWSPGWWSALNYHLPVLRDLVWANVMIVFVFISLGVLAGEGINAWMLRPDKPAPVRLVAGLTLALSLVYVAGWWRLREPPSIAHDIGVFAWFLARGRMISALGLIAAVLALGGWLLVRGRVRPGAVIAVPALFAGMVFLDVVVTGWAGAVRKDHFEFPATPSSIPAPGNGYLPQRSLHLFHFADWWRVKMPAQAGSEAGVRSFDGFISLPLLRYGEFLSLVAPRVMKTRNGKLAEERFMYLFKEDSFITPEAKALMDFLNVGWVVTGRSNVKFGPRYRFRWEPAPEFELRGNWSGATESAVWAQPGPGSFSIRLALLPGSRFRMGWVRRGPVPVSVVVLARAEGAVPSLFYARTFGPGPDPGQGAIDAALPMSAPGEALWTGAALPVTGAAGMDFSWLDPMLQNDNQPLTFVADEGDVSVYRNPDALPLIFPVHEFKVLPGAAERLDYIREHPDRLAREVVLDREPGLPVGWADPSREPVAVREYQDQRLVFETSLNRPGLMVMSESYYPGWKARTREGLDLPVWCGDHAFRAVWVPEGRQEVTMTFEPAGFRIGLWVSLGTMMTMALAMVRMVLSNRSRDLDRPRA